MSVEIVSLPVTQLVEYAEVSIAFEVTGRFVPMSCANGELASFRVVPLAPHRKDYDLASAAGPMDWAARHDLARWGLLIARHTGVACGAAAVAPPSDVMPGVALPPDAAVLWDLRVGAASRGKGIGTALFGAARRWALEHGWRGLVVETQDTNVPACCFYRRMGCRLLEYRPDAYASIPGEARLLWHSTVAGGATHRHAE